MWLHLKSCLGKIMLCYRSCGTITGWADNRYFMVIDFTGLDFESQFWTVLWFAINSVFLPGSAVFSGFRYVSFLSSTYGQQKVLCQLTQRAFWGISCISSLFFFFSTKWHCPLPLRLFNLDRTATLSEGTQSLLGTVEVHTNQAIVF